MGVYNSAADPATRAQVRRVEKRHLALNESHDSIDDV